ncbi:FecCD family ABC transporter permease [Pseudonocardia hispaniensis]|uniref:FecCD family ABC transporter permease n=1 Tax=Pseudonocardia hispaniensis TaxID=904933 RepID=A0ABW1J9Q9_9PSEU
MRLLFLFAGLVAIILVSFPLGPFGVDTWTVLQILFAKATGTEHAASTVEETVVMQVRLPRIIGAVLVGAGLAAAGAGYQSMFRNPLVSPAILGVSAGAGFGAALGLLAELPWTAIQLMAFGFGLVAAALALTIARLLGRGSTVVLVLAGIVVSTLFQAFISITQFLANPEDTLPSITFWLMGGLGRIRVEDLLGAAVVIAVCLAALHAVRWPVTVLAAGSDEASTLGINRRLTWAVVIGASTLLTATAVGLAGIVGWVGLVVPHLARMLVGPSFDRLLPAAVLMGAGFLVLVDDVARSAPMELPLGVLTAVIGAPFFVLLLARARSQWL